MKKIIILLILCSGCDDFIDATMPDQCLRRKIFLECMNAVPKGPETVVDNDWADVVDECQSASYYQSLRRRSTIEPKCRTR